MLLPPCSIHRARSQTDSNQSENLSVGLPFWIVCVYLCIGYMYSIQTVVFLCVRCKLIVFWTIYTFLLVDRPNLLLISTDSSQVTLAIFSEVGHLYGQRIIINFKCKARWSFFTFLAWLVDDTYGCVAKSKLDVAQSQNTSCP